MSSRKRKGSEVAGVQRERRMVPNAEGQGTWSCPKSTRRGVGRKRAMWKGRVELKLIACKSHSPRPRLSLPSGGPGVPFIPDEDENHSPVRISHRKTATALA